MVAFIKLHALIRIRQFLQGDTYYHVAFDRDIDVPSHIALLTDRVPLENLGLTWDKLLPHSQGFFLCPDIDPAQMTFARNNGIKRHYQSSDPVSRNRFGFFSKLGGFTTYDADRFHRAEGRVVETHTPEGARRFRGGFGVLANLPSMRIVKESNLLHFRVASALAKRPITVLATIHCKDYYPAGILLAGGLAGSSVLVNLGRLKKPWKPVCRCST